MAMGWTGKRRGTCDLFDLLFGPGQGRDVFFENLQLPVVGF
jgi:hypothetical protein